MLLHKKVNYDRTECTVSLPVGYHVNATDSNIIYTGEFPTKLLIIDSRNCIKSIIFIVLSATVTQLKEEIKKQNNINDDIMLHFNGEILEDSDLLSDYDIENDSNIIYIVVKNAAANKFQKDDETENDIDIVDINLNKNIPSKLQKEQVYKARIINSNDYCNNYIYNPLLVCEELAQDIKIEMEAIASSSNDQLPAYEELEQDIKIERETITSSSNDQLPTYEELEQDITESSSNYQIKEKGEKEEIEIITPAVPVPNNSNLTFPNRNNH